MLSHRAVLFAVFFAACVGRSAEVRAQEAHEAVTADRSLASVVAAWRCAGRCIESLLPIVGPPGAVEDISLPASMMRVEPRRVKLMWSLYAATAALQVIDVHSTRTALAAGASEGNPMMRGLAGNTPALLAVKAGMATGMIVAADRMSRHNKVAAAAALIAVNVAYVLAVRHNYDVARRAR